MGTNSRTFIFLAIALLLSACLRTKWRHTSKDRREFYRDKAKCSAQAGQASANVDPDGAIWYDTFNACMYGEGWTATYE